jgi:hypothetical protein
MSVQVMLRRLSGASVDGDTAAYFERIARRSKCFSEGIGDDPILVRPENTTLISFHSLKSIRFYDL